MTFQKPRNLPPAPPKSNSQYIIRTRLIGILTGFVWSEGARVCPVAESWSFVFRSPAHCQDEREDDQAKHDENLRRTQPELELSKHPNAKIVYSNNSCQEQSDIDGRVGSWPIVVCFAEPKLDNENRGDQIVGCRDDILEPVIPYFKSDTIFNHR
jgi:hypothetical protein